MQTFPDCSHLFICEVSVFHSSIFVPLWFIYYLVNVPLKQRQSDQLNLNNSYIFNVIFNIRLHLKDKEKYCWTKKGEEIQTVSTHKGAC